MNKQEAIKILNTYDLNFCDIDGNPIPPQDLAEAFDMAIEALQDKWIPVKWHEITDEERDRDGCPKDWVYYLDCEMPYDEQRILITTKNGFVELDECYCDGEFALDSGYDWIGDVLAWMPSPEPYKESEKE